MTILNMDCVEGMRLFPDNYVDAIVTDPPYELGFMGKAWDASGIANRVEMWAEALRVLKPGGHLLAFSGSRTYHRMVCAIEDAGFEIRDQIMWVYGSGFPKSLNLSGDWQGWGTALKPAHEPIVVARKPLVGTVAANVLQFGTGALNIDGCRIATDELTPRNNANTATLFEKGFEGAPKTIKPSPLGRWPANLIHDGSDEVLAAFPQEVTKSSGGKGSASGLIDNAGIYGAFSGANKGASAGGLGDSGTPARFFYCPKASRNDRGAANNHPTVKPTELMRYLCRLVTPPGGTVLDPFAGSGSTGKACALEGFGFLGFELSPEYTAIAHARIEEARRVA